MVRKKDLIRLCEKHNDCIFLCFTNGTLIDEGFADDMLRVGNFIPAISLEGFEKATDQRRGKGVYEKATKTMKLLKEKKLLYGISACYTSANFVSITAEEFYDSLLMKICSGPVQCWKIRKNSERWWQEPRRTPQTSSLRNL